MCDIETATIDYYREYSFVLELYEYADLIIWYLRQLNMPEYFCGEGTFIGEYQRREIFIDILHWTVDWRFSTYKIPHTRTQFANKLAWCLAEHDAKRVIVACGLPQPLAEEIIPQITAEYRTSAIIGAYMTSAFETDARL